jgi:hypothetical protein
MCKKRYVLMMGLGLLAGGMRLEAAQGVAAPQETQQVVDLRQKIALLEKQVAELNGILVDSEVAMEALEKGKEVSGVELKASAAAKEELMQRIAKLDDAIELFKKQLQLAQQVIVTLTTEVATEKVARSMTDGLLARAITERDQALAQVQPLSVQLQTRTAERDEFREQSNRFIWYNGAMVGGLFAAGAAYVCSMLRK